MKYIFRTERYALPLGEKTYIMAVINLTPDSFFEGSRFTADKAVSRAVEAVAQGADIIDLGAQSTAPGVEPITAEQEMDRLLPTLRKIRSAVDVPISVDTYYTEVAKAALENGADIINDVSGKCSEDMAVLVKAFGAGWIIMHTGGLTSDMSGDSEDILGDVVSFFAHSAVQLANAGLSREQICFDPGIGFGKTREDDLKLIGHFSKICVPGCAMLAALSRKRVTRLSGDALMGTIAADTACILGGADMIRVHDVAQASSAAKMADLLRGV